MIITISRNFASGGSQIGKTLAEKLGIEYYDKSIIEMASEKSGICKEMFKNAEKKHSSFLYYLSMAHYNGLSSPVYTGDVLSSDKLYNIQSDIIREVAKKGPCVIVGRCANDVLKDEKDLITVFLHADLRMRINRTMEKYDMSEKEAETFLKKIDKKRASYYNFYTNRTWGEATDFDLSCNVSRLGMDGTAEMLYQYVLRRQNDSSGKAVEK